MQEISFKAGARATMLLVMLLLVMLAAAGPGQEVQELSPPSPSATTFKALPLDGATRSNLVEAMGKRNYTAAEDLLAAEATKNPKSQPLLLVLANVHRNKLRRQVQNLPELHFLLPDLFLGCLTLSDIHHRANKFDDS